MNTTDTIIALATPYGMGAIAVIRLSGKEAISSTEKVFQPKFGQKKLTTVSSHSVHLGYLMNGSEIVDEVLVTIFKNPHS